jgi:tetratricopeptide (TPR) repeat protein
LEAAKYFLNNSVAAGYENSKVQLYLGYLYLEGQQYKEAVELLTAAEKNGEKEIKLFESRGIAAYQSGNFELAVTDLEKVVKTGDEMLPVFEALGLSYVALEKSSKALTYLMKADSLSSKDPLVHFQLGNSLYQKKSFNDAIVSYSRAISFNFKQPEVFIHRGNAKIGAGLTKESLADFDQAIKLNPENAAGYRSRVVANLRLKDWSKVVTDLAIVNALGSKDADDKITLSVAKYNLKNFRDALPDVDAALAAGKTQSIVDGKMVSYFLHKGSCLVALKQYEAALSSFNQAQKEGINSIELYMDRARAYVGLGKFDNAVDD